jgi:ferredoxin
MTQSVGIFYFSGTGNTETVVNLLAKEFEDKGSHTDTITIEDVLKGKLHLEPEKYDIIGIAYPIYALNAPRIVFDFIRVLPAGDRKTFILKCSGDPFLQGGATTMVRTRLTKRGYHIFYETLIVMPSNVLVQYDDNLKKQLYNTAVGKTARIAEEILAGTVNLQKNGVFSRVVTFFFSGLEMMGAPFFGKDLNVLQSCDLCGTCVRNCPTNTIFRKGDTIRFGWNCIMCMRCIYNCPHMAIQPQVYRVFVLKDGYTIQDAIDDPAIQGDYISDTTTGYFKRFYDYIKKDEN